MGSATSWTAPLNPVWDEEIDRLKQRNNSRTSVTRQVHYYITSGAIPDRPCFGISPRLAQPLRTGLANYRRMHVEERQAMVRESTTGQRDLEEK